MKHYQCKQCGAVDQVGLDATAIWDVAQQKWVLGTTFDNSWCDNCGHDDPGLVEVNGLTREMVTKLRERAWAATT